MRRFVEVWIPGTPVAKGRARSTAVRRKDGQIATTASGAPIIRHYTPAKTVAWERTARQYARLAMRGRNVERAALGLQIIATMPIPEAWPKWKAGAALAGQIAPTTKPDADNITKATKDALTGVVWIDDCQVVSESCLMRYGAEPGVQANVWWTCQAPAQVASLREFNAILQREAERALGRRPSEKNPGRSRGKSSRGGRDQRSRPT